MRTDLRRVYAKRRKLFDQLAAVRGVSVIGFVIAEIIPIRFERPELLGSIHLNMYRLLGQKREGKETQYESHQKLNFSANCTCLGLFADVVTIPPAEVSVTVLGMPNVGVFVTLKNSALNCTRLDS